jgi:hypothetical protein
LVSPVIGMARSVVRAPLVSQTLALAGAFVCSHLLYGRIAGEQSALDWTVLVGLGSFLALFAQLRLIDDLDDLEPDHPVARSTDAQRSSPRARLIAALAACLVLVTSLNFAKSHALLAAAAATVLAFAAPFAFKRIFPRSLAIGSLVFEGAPFLIFAYGYFFWRDAGGPGLGFGAAMCVAALFWTGYEFWKFSRKVHTDAMQPYFLSPSAIRVALNAFLLVSLALNVALARMARLSDAYMSYAVALPLAWLIWTNATWPTTASPRAPAQRPQWAGLTFVAAVELGLLVQLVAIPSSI